MFLLTILAVHKGSLLAALQETVKLLEYYLEMPKNHDIELTTKWNGNSDRVRLVAHVWPYIAGAVDEIKVVTYEKGLLSP